MHIVYLAFVLNKQDLDAVVIVCLILGRLTSFRT